MTHFKTELWKRDPALIMCTHVFQLKVHSTLEGKNMLRQLFLNLQAIKVAFAVSLPFKMTPCSQIDFEKQNPQSEGSM